MREDRLSEWVSGREAAAIITANSGHEVSQRYVRTLAINERRSPPDGGSLVRRHTTRQKLVAVYHTL